jgi:enterochelin esterase family protein
MLSPPPQAGPDVIARNSIPVPYQIQSDNRVTFRLKAMPQATTVRLQGDWPGGIAGRTTLEMTKDAQGFWEVTTPQPLPSDVWSYNFSVNGLTVNPTFGQGTPPTPLAANTFTVPGSYGNDFTPHGAPRGTVVYAHVPFMGGTKDLEIFLPPGYYEHPNARYPVLYLTIGGGGEPGGVNGEKPEFVELENLIADGKATPMIYVTLNPEAPGGNSVGWAAFGGAGNQTDQRYVDSADAIATVVVPWVDHAFRTLAKREDRAIGGFSSAGAQGFMAGARHTDVFANLYTISGGYPTWPGVGVEIQSKLDPKQYEGPDLNRVPDLNKLGAFIPKLNADAKMKFVALYVGTAEPLIQTHELMKKFFADRGIKIYTKENPGQIHDGRNVRVSLHDLIPRLFKNDKTS